MSRLDVYNINAILCAVNSAKDDVEANNGEVLTACVELIVQTLEPVDADLRSHFRKAIFDAIEQNDIQSLAKWLRDPVLA